MNAIVGWVSALAVLAWLVWSSAAVTTAMIATYNTKIGAISNRVSLVDGAWNRTANAVRVMVGITVPMVLGGIPFVITDNALVHLVLTVIVFGLPLWYSYRSYPGLVRDPRDTLRPILMKIMFFVCMLVVVAAFLGTMLT